MELTGVVAQWKMHCAVDPVTAATVCLTPEGKTE